MLELRREARNNGTTQLEQEEVDREAEWIRASEYHAARLRDETRQNRQERLDREDRRQDDIIRGREGALRGLTTLPQLSRNMYFRAALA